MEAQNTPPKTAQPPFDDPAADVVLRTTDNVDVHIHSVILRLTSSHFSFLPEDQHKADSLAQAVSSNKAPQAFSETSTILDRILRFCYPCADPVSASLDDLSEVIAAMSKHSLEDSTVMRRPGRMLLEPRFLRESPVRVFAIAYQYGWRDIMEAAARETLKFPLESLLALPHPRELLAVPSVVLYKLLAYRERCGHAAMHAAYGLALNDDGSASPGCKEHGAYYCISWRSPSYHTYLLKGASQEEMGDIGQNLTYSWLWNFADEGAQQVKQTPVLDWSDQMEAIARKHVSIASSCPKCRDEAGLLDTNMFRYRVRKAIESVDVSSIFD